MLSLERVLFASTSLPEAGNGYPSDVVLTPGQPACSPAVPRAPMGAQHLHAGSQAPAERIKGQKEGVSIPFLPSSKWSRDAASVLLQWGIRRGESAEPNTRKKVFLLKMGFASSFSPYGKPLSGCPCSSSSSSPRRGGQK